MGEDEVKERWEKSVDHMKTFTFLRKCFQLVVSTKG